MKNSNKYFTLNFFKKQICGSKKAFAMANKGSGDAYEQLMALMNAHPDFELEVVKAKSNSSKRTYEGLDFGFMKDYILLQENKVVLLEKMERVKASAKKSSASTYPLVKKWFLNEFGVASEEGSEKEFDMATALELVKKAKEAQILAAADVA
jgi:hypothetical protein